MLSGVMHQVVFACEVELALLRNEDLSLVLTPL